MEKKNRIENYEFVSFTSLGEIDQVKVLGWRNHPLVREQMTNQSVVLESDHLQFINRLNDSTDFYYLVRKNDKDLGVAYYNLRDGKYYLGLYLKPDLIGGGLGVDLFYISTHFFFEEFDHKDLFSFVRKDNADSLSLQSFFGYRLIDQNENFLFFKLNLSDWLGLRLNSKNLKRSLLEFYKRKG